MSGGAIEEIIRLCLAIDTTAEAIYAEMAVKFHGHELAAFWQEMSLEEGSHIAFWQDLLALAEEGMLTQVFDDPRQVIDELKHLDKRIQELTSKTEASPNINEAFLLSYRLEFYLMHPALGALFHYGRMIGPAIENESPMDKYDYHISRFIEALNKHGRITPEMELVGETLHRLWAENRKIITLINVDPLTGILNRRGFFQALHPLAHLAHRNGFQVGILMIDVDNFKKVNDEHGHLIGDQILRDIAETIKKATRDSDLVGRYGGEEFIVFLARLSQDALIQVAEKIRAAVEIRHPEGLGITLSLGGAHGILTGDVSRSVESMIKEADDCLYEAKRKGRNRIVVSAR